MLVPFSAGPLTGFWKPGQVVMLPDACYEKLSAGHEANLRAELGREYEILDQLSRADHWRGGTQWWWESRHLLRPSPSPAP